MKKSSLIQISIMLIVVLVLALIPTFVRATDINGIILLKTDGEKVIYIKDMENTEYKYAFSDNNDATSATYLTATKDSNDEFVAFIEKGQTYKYMFVKNGENIDTVELSTLKSITEQEIKDVEKLTKIIGVNTEESTVKVSQDKGTTVTKTRGKIVITDEGDYQYQLIEVLDKNNSTSNLNETAVELYNQLSALENANKMYDKLLAEITIRDNYKKLLDEANWKDATNKEILQPEDSQEGEKFVVLIRQVENEDPVRNDVQFMTCGRADDEGVEVTEKQEKKTVEKKTALPVTGENLALYIIFGIIILAIIVLIVRMQKSKEKGKRFK